MSDSTVTRVELADRSYPIQIGSGNLDRLAGFIEQLTDAQHLLMITDSTVDGLYADAAADRLVEASFEVDLLIVEPGEASKSIDAADELWQAMLEAGADRKSAVVACGGGVVGDLAGFVAATYARGVPLVQVPTTLLAQVDSSVGGKVGINLPGAKNMVGAFWQPLGVLCDVSVLTTLPEREYRAGLAEVVKYGVVLDENFFAYLEEHVAAIEAQDPAVLTRIVERCCRLKADVVEADERETSGQRAILNYGHTFAHAFEAVAGYGEMLHGEAVAAGMRCAAKLARLTDRVDDQFVARQEHLLQALKLDHVPPAADPDELIARMAHDKKNADGQIRFILPTRMGHVRLVDDVRPADIAAALSVP